MMSQSVSIRFQPPEQLSGPAKGLLALLRSPAGAQPIGRRDVAVEPLALPPSPEQEQLNARANDLALRRRLRNLENERALKTVDGSATWVITDRLAVDPDLGERIGNSIVGAGLGKGRIIYGPHDLCLPSGRYWAIIELRVTNMLDRRSARVTGEVILNNQRYLSQQTKMILAKGSYVFRLPFRVRESDLFRYSTPALEVRLNVKSVVGVKVKQVAIVSKPPGIRNLLAHPWAHLHSAGNAGLRWLGRSVAKPRA